MNPELEKMILRHVARKNYRPVKPKKIAQQLQLSKEATKIIRKLVKRMVHNGRLAFGPDHTVLPASANNGLSASELGSKHLASPDPTHSLSIEPNPIDASSAPQDSHALSPDTPKRKKNKKDGKRNASARDDKNITGVFHRAAAGFGFIRPTGTAVSAGRNEDIFVPLRDTKDAANGDIVRVRLKKRSFRGRGRGKDNRSQPTGEVLEIIERKTRQFVGSYFEQDSLGYVTVDGNLFSKPIFVGDPGARNVQPSDKVVLEIVQFPKAHRTGEGVITQVLGKSGQPKVDTALVIAEFSLPEEFDDDVVENSRQVAAAFDETDLSNRSDFTQIPVLTIDPVDARDFDDAISLRRLKNGHWQLGVHIADVAHFVRPGSALDHEARDRGTSVYLPDRVIPMLPEIISNNLASLQPEKIRYSKTAMIEFTADGTHVATDLCSSAIRSDRRFTYEEVDAFLDDKKPWKKELRPEIFELLENMHTLAMILRSRRMAQGALELSMPEIKIDLDEQGRVCGARATENTVSHQIIEEFMLAANIAVAQSLRDRGIPFLRRMHENPDPEKLRKLTAFVRHLGFDVESLESRFEIQKLLEQIAGKPEEYAVNFATLRSMSKAVYSPDDVGHFALNAESYAHFTSPIRRYPDLTIHRLIEEIESGKKNPGKDAATLNRLGEHCSEREQRATKAERELTRLKLLNFMNSRIGERMQAHITGVEHFGFFVMGKDIPAEGLVALNSLEGGQYDYDEAAHAIVGRQGASYALGDTVEVEVASVDLDRRELDFRVIRSIQSHHPAASNNRRTTTGRSRRSPPSAGAATKAKKKRKAKPSAQSRHDALDSQPPSTHPKKKKKKATKQPSRNKPVKKSKAKKKKSGKRNKRRS